MKKLVLVVVMAFGMAVNAQENQFNLGVNLGLPVGNSADGSSFTAGIEANYLFKVSDKFKVGPSVSYQYFFGKNFDIPPIIAPIITIARQVGISDFSFLPIAAAARYNISEHFILGADIGYAIGISPSNIASGLYYRPMIGYNISENIMLQATYSGISANGKTVSNFGLGAMFSL